MQSRSVSQVSGPEPGVEPLTLTPPMWLLVINGHRPIASRDDFTLLRARNVKSSLMKASMLPAIFQIQKSVDPLVFCSQMRSFEPG